MDKERKQRGARGHLGDEGGEAWQEARLAALVLQLLVLLQERFLSTLQGINALLKLGEPTAKLVLFKVPFGAVLFEFKQHERTL